MSSEAATEPWLVQVQVVRCKQLLYLAAVWLRYGELNWKGASYSQSEVTAGSYYHIHSVAHIHLSGSKEKDTHTHIP